MTQPLYPVHLRTDRIVQALIRRPKLTAAQLGQSKVGHIIGSRAVKLLGEMPCKGKDTSLMRQTNVDSEEFFKGFLAVSGGDPFQIDIAPQR